VLWKKNRKTGFFLSGGPNKDALCHNERENSDHILRQLFFAVIRLTDR
jgi:hypothetical protein